jgi:hypothetical protein
MAPPPWMSILRLRQTNHSWSSAAQAGCLATRMIIFLSCAEPRRAGEQCAEPFRRRRSKRLQYRRRTTSGTGSSCPLLQQRSNGPCSPSFIAIVAPATAWNRCEPPFRLSLGPDANSGPSFLRRNIARAVRFFVVQSWRLNIFSSCGLSCLIARAIQQGTPGCRRRERSIISLIGQSPAEMILAPSIACRGLACLSVTMTSWSRALARHVSQRNGLSCRECNQAAFSDLLSLLSASVRGLTFGIRTIERLLHSTCLSLSGLLKLKCANTEFAVSCMRVPGR